MSKNQIEWERYQERLHKNGITHRERAIMRAKEQIRKSYLRSPACREVLVDEVPQYLFIGRTSNNTQMTFNTLPDESIELGMVVLWEGSHWLVVECLRDDDMTYHGKIELCNRQLVWQNPDTREIIKRWCVITKPYYSNLYESDHVITTTREFKIQLPYDFESSLIDLDKRFILDVINGRPRVYKCASVDANTERFDVNDDTVGFLVLNVVQDEYNEETDNKELLICDYEEPHEFTRESEGGYCVLDSNSRSIAPGGLPLTIIAKYFDKDGLPFDADTTWTVKAPLEAEGYLATVEDGNKVTLKLKYYSKLIGKAIIVEASARNGTISERMIVRVVNAV